MSMKTDQNMIRLLHKNTLKLIPHNVMYGLYVQQQSKTHSSVKKQTECYTKEKSRNTLDLLQLSVLKLHKIILELQMAATGGRQL